MIVWVAHNGSRVGKKINHGVYEQSGQTICGISLKKHAFFVSNNPIITCMRCNIILNKKNEFLTFIPISQEWLNRYL
jgi:hypothetical protein